MVADKIHFQNGALALAFLSRFHHWDLSHVNGKASQSQLIVDGVLKEVCEFRLAKVKTGVAKPKVGEIELGWGINVPLALDIVPDGFFDEEGILKEVEIILDGIPGQIAFLDGLEAPDFVIASPKFFVKEFSDFLMSCQQHCLGVNLLVQR